MFSECYCVFVLNFSATTCSTLIESHPGLSSVNFSTTPHQCATKDTSDIIYNIFQYSTFFNIQTHFQNDFSKAHLKCAIDKGSMPTTSVCDEWRGQLAAYKEQLAGDIMEMKSFILSGYSFPSERARSTITVTQQKK